MTTRAMVSLPLIDPNPALPVVPADVPVDNGNIDLPVDNSKADAAEEKGSELIPGDQDAAVTANEALVTVDDVNKQVNEDDSDSSVLVIFICVLAVLLVVAIAVIVYCKVKSGRT